MAADETAVLDPEDTGLATEEQEADELAENTEEDADAETAEAEETENEDDDDEPLLSKGEVEKLVKAERAKAEESFRQKTENAERAARDRANADAFTAQQQQAEQARNGAVYRGFAQMASTIKAVIDRGDDINPQWLQTEIGKYAGQASSMAFVTLRNQWDTTTNEWLEKSFPDFRPPKELAQKTTRAIHAGDQAAQAEALFETIEAAVREKLTPVLKKELAEAGKSAGKTAAIKNADQSSKSAPRPTNVTGGPSAGLSLTTAELDSMPPSAWGQLTADQKERVYANVPKADAAHGASTVRPGVAARWK